MSDAIRTVIAVALPAMMFAHGLSMRVDERRAAGADRPWWMSRAVLAVIVLVPLFALLVLLVVPTTPRVRVGIAIMAASPVAPLALGRIVGQRGDVPFATAMHLTLGSLAVFTTPIVLAALGAVLGFRASVGPSQVAGQLATALLAPMVLGIVAARRAPALARLARPIGAIAKLALAIAVVLILVASSGSIFAMDVRSYVAMTLFVAGALAIGHLLGGPRREDRVTLALETSFRNPGLALLIASVAFPEGRPLAVLVPYIVTAFVVQSLYLAAWRRRDIDTEALGAPAPA
ncbi:bile acid:sodium symporter family protein [Sandaracinus amylolyticus]|uniref:Putative sodium dependent transporter n=1 Tax=Sandaracinus amylolyticus TaxID=927083 RepID=A0A0F6YMG8_9BACT|nr:hypothetical protein [Sandaracinus amylolyticus]AKF10338.1 putative sodium dependent transporter [Sandaracinus amylolyticus]